jgi:hypothetical protein
VAEKGVQYVGRLVVLALVSFVRKICKVLDCFKQLLADNLKQKARQSLTRLTLRDFNGRRLGVIAF